jgi:DNA-binding HxlR family transcriptional regulator
MASERIAPKEIPPCGCSEPGEANAWVCYCAVEDLLRVIRRRYALAVLNAISVRGAARYSEIETALGGVSTSTLSETLHALEHARLLDRHAAPPDAAPHTTYTLTGSGAKLLGRFRQFLDEVQDA